MLRSGRASIARNKPPFQSENQADSPCKPSTVCGKASCDLTPCPALTAAGERSNDVNLYRLPDYSKTRNTLVVMGQAMAEVFFGMTFL